MTTSALEYQADLTANLTEGQLDLPTATPPSPQDAWKAEKADYNLRADQGLTAARTLAASILPSNVEKLALMLQHTDDPDVVRKSLETLHRIAQDPDRAVAQTQFGVSLSLTIAPSTTPPTRPIDVRRGGKAAPSIPLADIVDIAVTPTPPPDTDE